MRGGLAGEKMGVRKLELLCHFFSEFLRGNPGSICLTPHFNPRVPFYSNFSHKSSKKFLSGWRNKCEANSRSCCAQLEDSWSDWTLLRFPFAQLCLEVQAAGSQCSGTRKPWGHRIPHPFLLWLPQQTPCYTDLGALS